MAEKPPYRGTRIHGFRIPDDLWEQSTNKARENDEHLTAVVIRALREYVAE